MLRLRWLYWKDVLSLTIAIALGLALGIFAVRVSPILALAGIGGAVLLGGVLSRPELGLLVILIGTSTIVFEDRLPLVPIGIGSLHLVDVLLLGILAMILVRALAEPHFKWVRTPLDLPVLAFYGVALLATFLAIREGAVSRQDALRDMRVISYYLIFFAATQLIRSERQQKLLIEGMFALGTVVSLAMIAQNGLGASIQLVPGRVENLYTQGTNYSDITRVIPPGESLVAVSFVGVLALVVTGKTRSFPILRLLQLGILGIGLVLTFYRNLWASAGLAILLLAWLGGRQARKKILQLALISMVLLGMILLPASLLSQGSRAYQLVVASITRLGTLTNPDTLQESSLEYRQLEADYATAQIQAHPLLGVGLGTQYRPWDQRLDSAQFDGRSYIHFGHLAVITKTGFLGYGCLILMLAVFLVRGFKYWKLVPQDFLRAGALSFTISILTLTIGAITSPLFLEWQWIPVLGLMLGLNETMFARRRRAVKDPVAGRAQARPGLEEPRA